MRFYSSTSRDFSSLNINYPDEFELLTNGLLVPDQSNLIKKEWAGSPICIESFLRLQSSNRINIKFQKGYTTTFMIQITESVSNNMIIEGLPTISLADVIANRNFVFNPGLAQNATQDIFSGVEIVSLMDPYSLGRIAVPIRSSKCTHLRCFDAITFLEANRKNPEFMCPDCSTHIPYDTISIDGYFKSILEKLGQDIEAVKVFSDMSWTSEAAMGLGFADITAIKKEVIEISDDENDVLISGPAVTEFLDLTEMSLPIFFSEPKQQADNTQEFEDIFEWCNQ